MNGKVILVAEDSQDDVEAVRHVLAAARVLNPVHFVSDGGEALAYLQSKGAYADRDRFPFPALLLVDLVMPFKSGMEVLDWLHKRSEDQYRQLGKIAMTGMGNIAELQQAYRLGAHSFLIKPVRVEDFVNLVNGLKGIRLESNDRGRHLDFIGS